VQRQENKDQRCLQHVCRRSHPLNLNMERSFQSERRFYHALLSVGLLVY
jgi:hypothetical protein